jgi:hypothetical protein
MTLDANGSDDRLAHGRPTEIGYSPSVAMTTWGQEMFDDLITHRRRIASVVARVMSSTTYRRVP